MITLFKHLPHYLFIVLTSILALADAAPYAENKPMNEITMPTLTQILNKSLTDTNNYAFTTLSNNLKVVLVNDPKAEKFSASLSVNVGSFQDPKKQQGLAHFLEHMLFLGTEKYPKAGDYHSYISANGGSHNAYTSTDTTNFYFDIKPNAYNGALDRFSQFFITPLFSESLTQREKNAVNAEYKAKFKTESRRNNQAFKTLINTEHPYSSFTVGNLDTLKDLPNNPLRKQLLSLYEENYFAENMVLVMVANLSLEKTAKLAEEYFSGIKNHDDSHRLKSQKADIYPTLIPVNTPRLQFVKPLIDNSSISFYYQIDAQNEFYKTQPTRYLSYIFGNENTGSLYSTLKSEGLINGISANASTDYGDNAFFIVKINLTDEGMSKIDSVAKRFFATISLLRSSPINSIYLEEGLKLSQLMFNHQNYVDPKSLARALSTRALKKPLKDLLSSYRLDKMASEKQVRDLLQKLNTENLLIQIASNKELPEIWAEKVPEWNIEPWYKSTYSNNYFSQYFLNLASLSVTNTIVSLPERNQFIPDSLTLISEKNDTPEIVLHEEGFTHWNKSDSSFDKPTSMNFLGLRFEGAASTPENMLYNRLWCRLFDESVSEDTYSPYIAGLGYSFYPHLNGVTLRTSGYSDKQNDFTIWLVDQLFLFRPDFEQFERAKVQLQKDLANQKSRQAYQSANSAFSTLITKNSFTTTQLEEAISHLSLEKFQAFIKHAREQFNVSAYSTGNVTKEQTLSLATTLFNRFKGRLFNHHPLEVETKEMPSKQKLHYQFESTSNDNAVLYTLIDTSTKNKKAEDSIIEKISFSIFKQLISSPFYHQLRTEQQLGYIVGAQNLSTRNTPILGLLIQSPDKDTKTLTQAVERFLEEQEYNLQNLSDKDFLEAKSTLLNELTAKAKKLSDNAFSEWGQIAKIEPNFNAKQDWVDATESLKKEDVISFIEKKLQSEDSTRIVIHNKELEAGFAQKERWIKTSPEMKILGLTTQEKEKPRYERSL